MVQVKLSAKHDPRTQEVLENLGREAQKTFGTMIIPFTTIFEAQQRAFKTILPIQNSLTQLAKTIAPAMGTINRLVTSLPQITSPVFERETFFIPPPVRPLSANDVAELVVEKLRGKTITLSTIPPNKKNSILGIPNDKNWSDLEMCFKNESELTILCNGQKIGDYDYIDLGLCRHNTKPAKPDYQWELLKQLATIFELGDKLFVPTIANLADHLKIHEDQVVKRLSLLSKKLSVALGMTGSPFYPYSKDGRYGPKFILRPVAALRGNGELHASGGTYRDDLVGETPEYDI